MDDDKVLPVSANSPESGTLSGGLPDHPVLNPDDAKDVSLYRIVDRRGPLGQRILRADLRLPVEDYLELLALGAAAARAAVHHRGFEIAMALWVGATWRQVATATGLTVAEARTEFEKWGSGPAAKAARRPSRTTFEDEVGRYLRAGDEESLRLRR